MNSNYTEQKPGLVTAIAAMTLTSGIINLFWGFVASATALGTVIGAICLPFTILPTILGVFEIIYAAKLLSSQPQPVQASHSIAVFQIVTSIYGNVFSMIVGILNLVFFNDLAVKEFFERRNGMTGIVPVAKMPVVVEPVSAEPEAEVIQSESKDPKRIRKIAGK